MSPKNDLPSSSHPSPSDPLTMQSLRLPVEVIESVIDCCSGNKATLRAFALTCRDLHPRSILVLFKDVRLKRRDRVFDFCDVLRAKPERQPFICEDVDGDITQSLLGIAPHETAGLLHALNCRKPSSTPHLSSSGIHQFSFRYRIFACPMHIKRAVDVLAGPVAMKMSTITVFLSHDD
ncbi:hypothetical protein BD311DRAFT_602494, partial [Dichomitus squalens]